jgi:ubiquinone biosynthesis protein UbiJ
VAKRLEAIPVDNRIRGAITRLQEWVPGRLEVLVSGDLSDVNLAKEAGVSRATLYRAELPMSEWNDYLGKVESGEVAAHAPRARIRQLKRQIDSLKVAHAERVSGLEMLLTAYAMQIVGMAEQIKELRDEVERLSGVLLHRRE